MSGGLHFKFLLLLYFVNCCAAYFCFKSLNVTTLADSSHFSSATGVAVRSDNTVVVSDRVGHSIYIISTGGSVSKLAGSGTMGFADGSALAAQFNSPTGVAVRTDNSIIVADTINNRVRLISGGSVSTFAGDGTQGHVDGAALSSQFSTPVAVAIRSDGGVIVADFDTSRIRLILNNVVSTLAGNGNTGHVDGPALSASFSAVSGLAVRSDDSVIVADSGNNLIRLISQGVVSTLAGSNTSGHTDGPALSARFFSPQDVAVLGDGSIVVADRQNHQVRLVANGSVTTLAGTANTGNADGAALSATFNQPFAVALRTDGSIVVAELTNHDVRLVDAMSLFEIVTIQLSAASVSEHANTGTDIGVFTPNEYQMTLIQEYGNGNRFSVTNNHLRTAASLDDIESGNLNIAVKPSDPCTEVIQQVFTITVIQVDDLPTAIQLSSLTVSEHATQGTPVGLLSTTDADSTQHTYSFVSGTGSTDNSKFTIVSNELRTAVSLDNIETAGSTLSIRIRSTDERNQYIEQVFTITVIQIDDLPTAIHLNSTTVSEHAAVGTLVAQLTTTDFDSTQHTYTLVSGVGDTDNGKFVISGTELRTNAPIQQHTFAIRIRTTDERSQSLEMAFTITVLHPFYVTPTLEKMSAFVGVELSQSFVVFDVYPNATVQCTMVTTLPKWLTFVYNSRQINFLGTPTRRDVANTSTSFHCNDDQGLTATVSFLLQTVSSLNVTRQGTHFLTIDTPASYLSVTLQLSDPTLGRLVAPPNAPTFVVSDEDAGTINFFGQLSVVNNVLKLVRYVPKASRSRVAANSVTVTIDDGINNFEPLQLLSTEFRENMSPRGVSAQKIEVKKFANEESYILLTPHFVDDDNDAMVFSIQASVDFSWISVEGDRLKLSPGKSDTGHHSIIVIASDPFGGTGAITIALKIDLTSFDMAVVVFTYLMEIGGPIISVLLFLLSVWAYRVSLYKHLFFKAYYMAQCPLELWNGEKYRAVERSHPCCWYFRSLCCSYDEQSPPTEPIAPARSCTCQVVELLPWKKEENWWCCGQSVGKAFQCHLSCICCSPRTKVLGQFTEKVLHDLPPWVSFDGQTNDLQFHRLRMLPEEVPKDYLIRILDSGEFISQEIRLKPPSGVEMTREPYGAHSFPEGALGKSQQGAERQGLLDDNSEQYVGQLQQMQAQLQNLHNEVQSQHDHVKIQIEAGQKQQRGYFEKKLADVQAQVDSLVKEMRGATAHREGSYPSFKGSPPSSGRKERRSGT